ncbi:MAG: histidine phosphatase family protein [Lachnospiraceae bacterium]|nr:histidine phosphatase family protein [Lachnospiraceae bacterium]
MRDSSENKIDIILIRHGMTKNNLEKRYCGKNNNDDLLDDGIEKLKKNKAEGLYPSVDYLFSSSQLRALHTAKIIYPELEPIIIDEFDETDFGEFEGKNYEDLKDNPLYQKWIDSNGEDAFPGGESKAEHCERVKVGFNKVLEIASKKGIKSMAIVGHGGTIMAFLSNYASMNYYDCMVSTGLGYVCEYSFDTNHMSIKTKL